MNTVDDLIRVICEQARRGRGGEVSPDLVREVVGDLKLGLRRPSAQAPRLRISSLRFRGVKNCGADPEPFEFYREFQPGVNVLLVEDNSVGKSTVLKTIKLALTGDDSDLPSDVRRWIAEVWLQFSLGDEPLTVALCGHGQEMRGVLARGFCVAPLDELAALPEAFFAANCGDDVRYELQQFFFRRMGLVPLAWTEELKANPGDVRERRTSWLTYFQALSIPDDGHGYLLCDSKHAIGNQDGLIASAFLGLHLAEPINQLTVLKQTAEKQVRATDEEIGTVEAQRDALETEAYAVERRLREVLQAQRARRSALEGGDVAAQVRQTQVELTARALEHAALTREAGSLVQPAADARAQARKLAEALDLRLNLTGLDVRVCPNCDATVDPDDMRREREEHACRLCHRPASGAGPGDVERIRAALAEAEVRLRRLEESRGGIRSRLSTLRHEQDRLDERLRGLMVLAEQGLAYALPTPDEEQETVTLYQRQGRLMIELARVRERISSIQEAGSEKDLRGRIAERARRVLQREAEARNLDILRHLGELTLGFTRRMGAESITAVNCTSLGKIQLMKNGALTPFGGLKNQGEQMRVKASFFLAMMLLGRKPGLGRHPGFLLIDQPGSHEMVPEDRKELARILRQTDLDHSNDLQVLCFTAEPDFREATSDPEKVFGAGNGKWVF